MASLSQRTSIASMGPSSFFTASPDMSCRSLYGKCIFSHRTTANTDLSDELIAATKSSQFAANALKLQASFNATNLAYETAYWDATTAGELMHAVWLKAEHCSMQGVCHQEYDQAPCLRHALLELIAPSQRRCISSNHHCVVPGPWPQTCVGEEAMLSLTALSCGALYRHG